MRTVYGAVVMAALLGAAGPAGAQAFNGAAKIMAGDYAAAERDIVARRALAPDDVDLLLNLAAVYAGTGRTAKARAAYAHVAAMPDEDVVLRDGSTIGSRALAAKAMARMPAGLASR